MAEMNGLMLLQRREGWTRDNSCEAVRETCTNAVGENMSLHIATARHNDVGMRQHGGCRRSLAPLARFC